MKGLSDSADDLKLVPQNFSHRDQVPQLGFELVKFWLVFTVARLDIKPSKRGKVEQVHQFGLLQQQFGLMNMSPRQFLSPQGSSFDQHMSVSDGTDLPQTPEEFVRATKALTDKKNRLEKQAASQKKSEEYLAGRSSQQEARERKFESDKQLLVSKEEELDGVKSMLEQKYHKLRAEADSLAQQRAELEAAEAETRERQEAIEKKQNVKLLEQQPSKKC